uniref:ML-like domain-containing protein n=1 Tax=Mycena chlorophos TaxID=658473 RepID=A0ABQ0M629_MYCCL|nr:predicted protein [Mycena chlorophos]
MLLLLLLAIVPLTLASDLLFTSSVTFCQPPEFLLIEDFNLIYFNNNQSIFFNISAASVQTNVSVSANIVLDAYGMTLVNVSVALCDILGGALCPLPTYQFVGSQTISLPSSLGVAQHVPGIAFAVPDLEAYAQLTLVDVNTNEVKACVQATLSNGKSTHQRPVQWALGASSIAVLLGALWQTTRSVSHPLIAHRLVDLFHLLQFIASTGLLGLNYSLLYRAFTLNFAFALGLVSSTTLQTAINNMRAHTGGTLANSTSTDAVGFVDRKLSPFSTVVLQGLMRSSLNNPTENSLFDGTTLLDSTGLVPVVTNTSSDVLQAGIPIYTNYISIATANAFATVFLVGVIVFAIALTVAVLLTGMRLLVERSPWGNTTVQVWLTKHSPAFIQAWSLRLGLIALPPTLIFAFYQWTLKDSWLTTLLSVIMLLGVSSLVIHASYRIIRLVHDHTVDMLDTPSSTVTPYDPLYGRFRAPRYYFFEIFLAALILRAIVIAFGQGNGLAQVVVCMFIETGVLAAHVIFKPFGTRSGDIFSIYFCVVRLVSTGLMLAFVENLDVAPIPRVAIGAVIAVILAVAVILLLASIVLSLGQGIWRHRTAHGPRIDIEKSTLDSALPGDKSSTRHHPSSSPNTSERHSSSTTLAETPATT